MSEKTFMAGSIGPYVYDDADVYPSHFGVFAGYLIHAFISEGQVMILEAPSEDEHVVRLTDLLGETGVYNSLPTADPHVAGQLWNNSGVLTVSAG